MSKEPPRGAEQVRAAEVVAALSLATDLGVGVPLEHGLQSALFAMRLCDRLSMDSETASHAYYTCLLFHVGCTAGSQAAMDVFGGHDALTRYAASSRFGSRAESVLGIARALAPPDSGPQPVRVLRAARKLPRAAMEYRRLVPAFCEVAEMLSERLGLRSSVQAQFAFFRALGRQGGLHSGQG